MTGRGQSVALTVSVRVLVALWALLILAGFGVARSLTPSRLGIGTHLQLGFQPCSWLVMTGVRCPVCGMTTCFAHITRLEVADAWRANPVGLFLASWFAVQAIWCLAVAIRGCWIGPTNPATWMSWVWLVLIALLLLQWGLRHLVWPG